MRSKTNKRETKNIKTLTPPTFSRHTFHFISHFPQIFTHTHNKHTHSSNKPMDELILSKNSSDLHIKKSFHLFALLLSIGHPVTPLDLSVLSRDASPQFVEFMCSVANSSIDMTSDGLVTVSSDVFVALKRFLNNSRRNVKVLMSNETNELRCKRRCDEEMMLYRKRRRLSRNVFGELIVIYLRLMWNFAVC